MIAHRATKLQPALLALVEEGPQPTGHGLESDPLIDEQQQVRRRAMARTLCERAATGASWEIANRLAVGWGFSCQGLGAPKPADPEGERRRKNSLTK